MLVAWTCLCGLPEKAACSVGGRPKGTVEEHMKLKRKVEHEVAGGASMGVDTTMEAASKVPNKGGKSTPKRCRECTCVQGRDVLKKDCNIHGRAHRQPADRRYSSTADSATADCASAGCASASCTSNCCGNLRIGAVVHVMRCSRAACTVPLPV